MFIRGSGWGCWRLATNSFPALPRMNNLRSSHNLANQMRLILHTAAYWLMLTVRDAIPKAPAS
jgi:hypothetical protein